jgi:Ca-activated chloride channel family protein
MRLFGLQALPLVLALLLVAVLLASSHWLRRPSRRVEVPSLALWLTAVQPRERPWLARLRLGFLSSLAIAAALLLALGDPRPRYTPERVVLLIDRGVSMSAHDVSPTRLAEAKRLAHARIDALRGEDAALIISFAGHAMAHGSLTSERASLHAAVAAISASDAPSRIERALKLGSTLAPGARMVVFSDSASAPEHELVRVGRSARNVGISSFAARPYPLDRSHAEALLVLENFGDDLERGELRVHALGAHGALLHQESVSLPPGARVSRTLTDLPGRAITLQATLTLAAGPDALSRDDQALAVLDDRPAPRVLLVSAGDRYLEAALLVDQELRVTRIEPGAYRGPTDHDLVIFDRTEPREQPAVPALYLGLPTPLSCTGSATGPFFDRVRSASWLAGLSLRDVNIAQARRCSLQPGDVALGATRGGTPLLVQGVRAAPFVALTFALADSDLALRAAFPVLLLRALDQLTERAPERPPARAGEPLVLPLPRAASEARLRVVDRDEARAAPEGATLPVAITDAGAHVLVERAGRYVLEADALQHSFVVTAHAGPIRPGATPPSGSASAPAATLFWPWIAAAALLLLGLEWLAHLRRWVT